MIVEGRVWLFAEPNINTDLIMPVTAFRLPL
jgi:3-isopropylmalate dehydratase small subunit